MLFLKIYKLIYKLAGKTPINWNSKFTGLLSFLIAKYNLKNRVRYSGSIGNIEALQDLANILNSNNIKYYFDEFIENTPIGKVKFRNLVVDFKYKNNTLYIIIGAHHDSKYFPKYTQFEGANDGASGVGLIIGLILYLTKANITLPYNLKFILFDGLECYYNYTTHDGLFGSKYAANKYANICSYMILVDMIGSKSLKLEIPSNSDKQLSNIAKSIISELLYTQYFDFEINRPIIDDTYYFLKLQIPTINFIDFSYPYWHKEEDTIDKLAPIGFLITGNIILLLIRKLSLLK